MRSIVLNMPSSAADLVSRIRVGDQHAETELVECYNRVVMSIIRRKVGNTAVASDIYQETFCIVIEKIRQGDVREQEKLPGFVCAVARNQVLKYFQQTARRESLVETEEVVSDHHHDRGSNQLEELLLKEKVDLIRQVLREMTHQRDIQVLSRFYLAEEDKEQICEDLGLTSRQFNLVLHRARERYRELYELAIRRKHRSR